MLYIAIPFSYINQQSTYNANDFIRTQCEDGYCCYKLFNKYTVKKVEVDPVERFAYIGGFPIGISLKTEGVIVERVDEITTVAGKSSLKSSIFAGDVILSLNHERVGNAEDIAAILGRIPKQISPIPMKVLRGKNYLELNISPLIEEYTGNLRLGLVVKDSIAGIGTVTYVKQNGDFGALGHPICNHITGECLPCAEGSVFDCKVIGVSKGARGNPGEIKGVLKNTKHPIGRISANNKYGIYGTMSADFSERKLYEIANRANVTPGKAAIFTTIDNEADFYEIEIIKANYQNAKNDKSMIIRATDKRLLDLTGGVVQGMSGSPIIQNNKLIGAVTHVFVNDPTKGYGLYLDWMYEQ